MLSGNFLSCLCVKDSLGARVRQQGSDIDLRVLLGPPSRESGPPREACNSAPSRARKECQGFLSG